MVHKLISLGENINNVQAVKILLTDPQIDKGKKKVIHLG